MKFIKSLLSVGLLVGMTIFSGCFNFELFPDKKIIFEGRIVEAFDPAKPIDSVLVQGCIQSITLFPTRPSCDTETFTDNDGHFYISVEANDLKGRGISYGKEGYQSLDSCITLSNGKMECYIKSLPTTFYVYAPTKTDVPFIYDSLIIQISTELKDITAYYVTDSFLNTWGGTSYYWINKSHTIFNVPDNSNVRLEASYFKDDNLKKADTQTLFCPKGIGNSYKILDH